MSDDGNFINQVIFDKFDKKMDEFRTDITKSLKEIEDKLDEINKDVAVYKEKVIALENSNNLIYKIVVDTNSRKLAKTGVHIDVMNFFITILSIVSAFAIAGWFHVV